MLPNQAPTRDMCPALLVVARAWDRYWPWTAGMLCSKMVFAMECPKQLGGVLLHSGGCETVFYPKPLISGLCILVHTL